MWQEHWYRAPSVLSNHTRWKKATSMWEFSLSIPSCLMSIPFSSEKIINFPCGLNCGEIIYGPFKYTVVKRLLTNLYAFNIPHCFFQCGFTRVGYFLLLVVNLLFEGGMGSWSFRDTNYGTSSCKIRKISCGFVHRNCGMCNFLYRLFIWTMTRI